MTYIQALILGLVQGLTEFIPVSSSAHLVVVPWLFGWTNPALTSLPFDVALHLGTLVAVLVLLCRRLGAAHPGGHCQPGGAPHWRATPTGGWRGCWSSARSPAP